MISEPVQKRTPDKDNRYQNKKYIQSPVSLSRKIWYRICCCSFLNAGTDFPCEHNKWSVVSAAVTVDKKGFLVEGKHMPIVTVSCAEGGEA